MLGVFAAVFLLALVRHATSLGYLSGRHTLPLVLVSVPWAAAGTFVCLRGLGVKLPWSRRVGLGRGHRGRCGLVVAVLVAYQLGRATPPAGGTGPPGSGWPRMPGPREAVLDTRGWARFVSGAPGYDYWHVRQALTDSHLAYVVVGHEELDGRRARGPQTLRALLAYAATPVQEFPALRGRARRRGPGLPVPPARLVGGPGPMSYGSFWERLVRGVRWSWVDPRFEPRCRRTSTPRS